MKYVPIYEHVDESLRPLYDKLIEELNIYKKFFEEVWGYTSIGFMFQTYYHQFVKKHTVGDVLAEMGKRINDKTRIQIRISSNQIVIHYFHINDVETEKKFRNIKLHDVLVNYDMISDHTLLDLLKMSNERGYKPTLYVYESKGKVTGDDDVDGEENVLDNIFDFNIEYKKSEYYKMVPYFIYFANENTIREWWNNLSQSAMYNISKLIKNTDVQSKFEKIIGSVDTSANMAERGFSESVDNSSRMLLYQKLTKEVDKYVNFFESLGIYYEEEKYERTQMHKISHREAFSNNIQTCMHGPRMDLTEKEVMNYRVNIKVTTNSVMINVYSYEFINNNGGSGNANIYRDVYSYESNGRNIFDLLIESEKNGYKPILKIGEDTRRDKTRKQENVLNNIYQQDLFNYKRMTIMDDLFKKVFPYFVYFISDKGIKQYIQFLLDKHKEQLSDFLEYAAQHGGDKILSKIPKEYMDNYIRMHKRGFND